jgi:arsenate reductase
VRSNAPSVKRVVFLCTGNSCRSQMAEGFLRLLGGGEYEAFSAGTKPSTLNPMSVKAMAEVGIDISSQKSKALSALEGPFTAAVTVCDSAREACPVLPDTSEQIHWSFDDPAEATGVEEKRMEVFRRVRDEIRARTEAFLEESRG